MYKIGNNHKITAWLDLSTYCNAACPQCHRTSIETGDKEDWLPLVQWSLEQFVTAYPPEVVRLHKEFQICGSWGDPFMNKDIFEIIGYIRDSSPMTRIHCNTNASLRNPEWWWDLGVMGGDKLQVWFDVDGINQEMHSKYRQKTDLNLVLENLEAFSATEALSSVHCIVFKHNEDYLQDIENMVRDLGVRGTVLFERSNRFFAGPKFDFMNHEGNLITLEEASPDKEKLNSPNPIRDHHWRKKNRVSKNVLHN